MRKYKILIVGGTFDREYKRPETDRTGFAGYYDESTDTIIDNDLDTYIESHSLRYTYGKSSGIVTKVTKELFKYASELKFINGGFYDDLHMYLRMCKHFDIVFWWANVANDLPKIRDVKEAAPHVMLVTSKRNDNHKYSFMELNQKALASKSNLVFEFSKIEPIITPQLNGPVFNINVFDPLGCQWYNGSNITDCITSTMSRLDYIANITRQKTTQINTDNGLVLKWYFDCFAQKQTFSNKEIDIPDEQEFVDIVREYAETFHDILKPAANVTRFLGNCSMKPNTPPQVGRCSKGMPSFRKNGYVFVSQRNVDKEYLTLEHFVPTYLENNEVYYCGPNKPSVDTPIQLRLYEKLPNIHYMIHAHVYASDAAFTSYPIPCGAIEEVDEIIDTILREYGDLNQSKYILNLKGHGSIVMGQTLDDIKDIKYYGRTLPERFDT